MNDLIHVTCISELNRLLEIGKPLHPLVSILRHSTAGMRTDFENMRVKLGLYAISLKETIRGSFQYGRNSYDFDQGTLLFIAPDQVVYSGENIEKDLGGWTLFFHPDLILKSTLAESISKYHFFYYDVHEALHVSEKEKNALTDCVLKIEEEIRQNLDKHSQDIISHNVETILKYGQRYYDRQFTTRSNLSKDYLIKFETFLRDYFEENNPTDTGIPSVDMCGKAMNMSGKYLSDLLKAETGKSLLEHIHMHIIKKAKILLHSTDKSVNEIAYSLGFTYPQHFSKVFKTKTGVSPSDFRRLN